MPTLHNDVDKNVTAVVAFNSGGAVDTAAPSLESTVTGPTHHLQSIDFLRGLASLAVVALHATVIRSGQYGQGAWSDPFMYVMQQGGIGVPLFFVISGFCIHLRWAKSRATGSDSPLSFAQFWKRRLLRLHPPYLIALCVCMGIAYGQYRINGQALYSFDTPRGQVGDFLIHIFMLHGLHPDFDGGGGNPAFWTLAREEYFYLAYSGLLMARGRMRLWTVLAAVAVAGLTLPWLSKQIILYVSGGAPWWKIVWHPFNDSSSALVTWIQWCLGMAAVEFYYGLVTLPAWCRKGWVTPLCMGAAAFALNYLAAPIAVALWGLSFFFLLVYCISLEKERRWPQTWFFKYLAFIGSFSYSLYLIHNPVFVVWAKIELTLLDKLGMNSLLHLPVFLLIEWCCAVLVACVCGWLFFLLAERRFIQSSRAFQPESKPVVTAMA